MNLLLEKLPEKLTVDNQDYSVNTNFRDWIKFEIIMSDSKRSNEEKLEIIQSLFEIFPSNIDKATEQLIWFYQCGGENQTGKTSKSVKKVYDYESDQFLIYTAFIQYYKINLNSIEYMHWWTFRQMFIELPEESKIKKVMMYRGITLNSKMSKEQRQFYAEMKHLYALPDDRTKKQKANSFGYILANGMQVNK